MNKFVVSFIFCSLLFVGCKEHTDSTGDKPSHNEQVFWVNSTRHECSAGAGKKMCLQVSESDNFRHAEWKYFYNEIEGFTFKPGYFQQIKVEITERSKEETPADASTLQYKIIEVLRETEDKRILVNDIWVLKTPLFNKNSDKLQQPSLEISLAEMRVMGDDGCNQYTGDIKSFTQEQLEFDAIVMTKKMCLDQEDIQMFYDALAQTANYEREGLVLRLLNDAGEELLQFKKVD